MGVPTRSTGGSSRAIAAIGVVLLFCAVGGTAAGLRAGESPPNTTDPNETAKLATVQGKLSEKYTRLETLMLRAAEFDAGNNPRRSALLRQALAQSKDKHVRLQFETLVELLNQNKLSPALENQNQVVQDLKSLLDLLLTENRPDRLKSEQQRVRGYIKELERIIRQQRGVQGRTEGGDDKQRLATDQGRVAERTGQLGKTIDENEERDQTEPDDGSGDGQDGDREPVEEKDDAPKDDRETPSDEESSGDSDRENQKQDGDGQNKPGQKGQSDQPSGDPQQGSPGQPETQPPPSEDGQGESQQPSPAQPTPSGQGQQPPSSGQGKNPSPGQGQPQGPSPSPPESPIESENQDQQSPDDQQQGEPPSSAQDQYPGRQRIAEAEQKMREAQKRLDQAKRQEAVDQQEEARRLLEQAKAELEKILRQLREEEIERMLALLESRFRKMLEMQLKVYQSTKTLDEIPSQRRNRQVDIRAGKLSLDERRIVIEADKALALLREEGSSVAFPETVGQMREDMQQVVDRLARSKFAAITQGIEEDIIAALEEAIQALQQAQEEQSERQNQQSPPPGQSEDPPLVDALAELRLVKALQVRVNKRTNRYARLLTDMDDPAGQALNDELIEALENLSDREERIYRITRDIVEGRNK